MADQFENPEEIMVEDETVADATAHRAELRPGIERSIQGKVTSGSSMSGRITRPSDIPRQICSYAWLKACAIGTDLTLKM